MAALGRGATRERGWLLGAPIRVLEQVLGGALLIFTIIAFAFLNEPWPAFILDGGAFVIVILAGWWPRAGGLALVGWLLGCLLLTPATGSLYPFAVMISILCLGARRHTLWRRHLTVAYLMIAGIDMLQSRNGISPAPMLAFVLLVLIAWLIGDAFAYIHRQQEREAHLAVLRDRLSTARDLHDTVAHTLTLISLRADRAHIRGAATEEDLEFFVEASAQSVRELRAIMSLLRSDQQGPPSAIRTLMQLPEVVQAAEKRLRDAHFPVTTTIDGNLKSVPGPRVATLDKVAREATNNIIKHAMPGAPCQILVGVDDDEVVMAFINRLPHQTSPEQPKGHPPLGVAGMSERVAAVGGKLTSEATDNDWITQVAIPLGVATRGTYRKDVHEPPTHPTPHRRR